VATSREQLYEKNGYDACNERLTGGRQIAETDLTREPNSQNNFEFRSGLLWNLFISSP